jgi:hypothetical protein
VTLEIQDAAGTVLRTFSSAPAPQAGGGGGPGAAAGRIPSTSALWRPAPEPFSAGAGMHRVAWTFANGGRGGGGGFGGGGGGGGRGGGGTPVAGTFTAKLTANGKSYTQTFTVKPDPRSAGR